MQYLTIMVCIIDTDAKKINEGLNGFFAVFLKRFPSLNVLEQKFINEGCLMCEIKVDGSREEIESFFNQKEVQKFAQGSLTP